MADYSTTHEVDVHESAHASPGLLDPSASMVLWTWVTFFLLLAVLHKFAWKPILAALDAREQSIRQAVDDAEKATQELAHINATKDKLIDEAQDEAKKIIAESKKAAVETAKIIEHKAKEEAKTVLENARREISDEVERAQAQLKKESAEIAVLLAEKILEENLDAEKNQKLINQYIKGI